MPWWLRSEFGLEGIGLARKGQIMQTVMLTADQLDQAIAALKQGEVVAFPTETVYGLGADATNEQACQKYFKRKGARLTILLSFMF